MRAAGRLATWALLFALATAGACGGGKTKGGTGGSGGTGVGGMGGGGGGSAGISGGGGVGADDAGTAACLDTPGALPRPPSGRLPCELIPPGLQL